MDRMTTKNEVGRELVASELREKTVVVLSRPDSDVAVTAWVSCIDPEFVAFTMGVTRTTFLGKRQLGGIIVDDTGVRVHVFEYLGEV